MKRTVRVVQQDVEGGFFCLGDFSTSDFGTIKGDWAWQDGGLCTAATAVVTIELRDEPGFDGRCDALCFAAPGEADVFCCGVEHRPEIAAVDMEAMQSGVSLDQPMDAFPCNLVFHGDGDGVLVVLDQKNYGEAFPRRPVDCFVEIPSLVAPSPEETYTTSSFPSFTAPMAVPTACRNCVPVGEEAETMWYFRHPQ